MLSPPSMAFEVVTPLIILVGLAGNIIVCSLIIKNKKMRTPFNYLLFNLAVSDLLCSILGGLFYVGQMRYRYFSDANLVPSDFEGIACKIVTVSIGVTTNNSVLTLAAISTDRFYAIVHPWRHKQATTTRKIRILLAFIWLVAAITSLPMLLVMVEIPSRFEDNSTVVVCLVYIKGTKQSNSYKVVAFVDLIAAYIIPMAIIFRSSFAIIKHLWCRYSCSGDTGQPEWSQVLLKSRKRITRIVFSVILAFNVFWLPWAIFEGSLLIGVLQQLNEDTFVVMFLLVLASASVNPILYSLQSRLFRNAVKKMFCC